jgi:hypothetical protein
MEFQKMLTIQSRLHGASPQDELLYSSSQEDRVSGASAVSFVLKHNLRFCLRSLQFWERAANKINIAPRYRDTF